MKKFKRLIVMLVVLTMALGCFVACGPSGDDTEDWGGTNGPVSNNNNVTTDPNNPSDPGNTTPGTNNTTPGTNNTTPGTNNTIPGSNNNTPVDKDDIAGPVEMSKNPLLSRNKKANTSAVPSIDVDKTGFSKGTVADLKGKTLTLYTGNGTYQMFSYFNENGKEIKEWDWFKEVKKQYGCTIKYTVSGGPSTGPLKAFQAMSAGKDLDLIGTHLDQFPYLCNIMAPMDNYANFNNFGNNPALDASLTNLTRWKGHPIVLSLPLNVALLVYDQQQLKSYGVDDPHELFLQGKWNWTNFKKYMLALPDKTKDGKTLVGMSSAGHFDYWPAVNGKPCFEIDNDNPKGGIINNWDTAECRESLIWLEGINDAGGCYRLDMPDGLFEDHKTTETLMTPWFSQYVDVVANPELKGKYNWVPFPKNEKNTNSYNAIATFALGIGLPRKTNKEGNRTAAMKFCELWATRGTEAHADHMLFRQGWSYEEFELFYNHVRNNTMLSISNGLGKFFSVSKSVHTAITSSSLSVATEMSKYTNTAKQEIQSVLKFGEQ